MNSLITPDSEPTNAVLVMPRRKFLWNTATLISAAFAGPAIVKASSLMDINSPLNRLVFALRSIHDPNNIMYPSVLNLGDIANPVVRAQWESQFPNLRYDLITWRTIQPENHEKYGANGHRQYSVASKKAAQDEMRSRIAHFLNPHKSVYDSHKI